MLNVSVVGIGNAGNQIAALASKNGFKAVALNSSEGDLSTVKDAVDIVVIGDKRGAGKDRGIAKSFITKAAKQLVDSESIKKVAEEQDVCVIVSSTGGGTGSGMAPVIQHIFSQFFPKTHFIIAGILPTLTESLATQHNTIGYLEDMLKSSPTYLLYDNEKQVGASDPTTMLSTINSQVLEDLKIIRGDYQSSTPFNSIDEQDSMKIYKTPGRLILAKSTINEDGDVEESLVRSVNSSAHSELDLDNVIRRRGLIYNLSDSLYRSINFELPLLTNEFGEPVEGFDHSKVNPKKSDSNSICLIMSGLSFPNDRSEKVVKRCDDAEKLIAEQEAQLPQSLSVDTSGIDKMRSDIKEEKDEVSLEDILGMYN